MIFKITESLIKHDHFLVAIFKDNTSSLSNWTQKWMDKNGKNVLCYNVYNRDGTYNIDYNNIHFNSIRHAIQIIKKYYPYSKIEK